MKKCFSLFLACSLISASVLFGQENYQGYQLARDYFNQKRYYDSINILENLNNSNNYDLDNSLLLIDSYINVYNYDKARDLTSKLRAYYPRNVEPLERELAINILENNNNQATSLITSIMALDNKNYAAKYYDGVLAEKSGYFDKAIKLYEQSLLLKDNAPEAVFALARLYQNKNQDTKALDLLTNNQVKNPVSEESYYNLANFYYLNDDLQSALEQVEQALSINPNYTEAQLLLGNIQTEMGLSLIHI